MGIISQANIAVNDVGEAVLSDIGIVRVALDDANPTTVISGLVAANATRWMAPELFDPHIEYPRLTKETDIYAFSMVAIEVCLALLRLSEYLANI